jgi:hypothetical protein
MSTVRIGVAVTVAAALSTGAQAAPPAFKSLRYDEDWRPLCARTGDKPLIDRLKCLTIGDGATLTLGGDLRERIEVLGPPGFGLARDHDHVFLHRALLHADLRVGDAVRGFVQVGYLDSSGREGPRPATDVDRLDLMQAFVDLSRQLGTGRATLRVGRQEVNLGSARLVSLRDGPNARRAFDGARGFWATRGLRVDGFYLQPVEIRRGTFDDRTLGSEALYGLYATADLGKAGSLDLYWLGYRRDFARFAGVSGRETRDSFGLRAFGKAGALDWNVEGVVQTGEIGARSIRAWTIATDTGVTVGGPLKPRLGLKADIASGNRRPAGGRFGTFNALYPRLPYFSEANLFVPANIIDLHPQIAIQPARDVTLTAGGDWAWRETRRDAIYLFPLSAVAGTAGQPGRFSGRQAILDAGWQATRRLNLSAEYVHFTPGAALRRARGKAGDFLMVAAGWRF